MKMSEQRRHGAGSVLTGVAVVLVLLVVVLHAWKRPREVVPELPQELPAVVVEAVVPSIVQDRLLVSGEVMAWASATLASEKAGTIVMLEAERGEDVEAGARLLGIDPEIWEQALAYARIEAEDAAREFERWEQLRPTGAVAENAYDAVARRHRLAAVQLDEARVELARCVVRAPFAGRIDARHVELGEYVTEGEAVFRLVDASRLKVRTRVSERDVAELAVGEMVSFTVSASGGGSHTGRVVFVAVEAGAQTHAFDVELEVVPPLGRLRPGMIAEVAFDRRGRSEEVAVPLAAIVPHKGDHVAFVVVDGVVEQRVVRISRLSGELAVLQSGLEAGDLLVVEGQRLLRDGIRVQVVEAGSPSKESDS